LGGPTYVSLSAANVAATYNATLIITIAPPPAPVLTVSPKIKVKNGILTLKGSADAGTVKVEVKVDKKGFKRVKGSPTQWNFPVRLTKAGKHKFQIRATNADNQVTLRTFTVRVGK
jgi:hypothetical protein